MKKVAASSIRIVVMLFAVATIAEAQPTKVPKIGWLGIGTALQTPGSRNSGAHSATLAMLRAKI